MFDSDNITSYEIRSLIISLWNPSGVLVLENTREMHCIIHTKAHVSLLTVSSHINITP